MAYHKRLLSDYRKTFECPENGQIYRVSIPDEDNIRHWRFEIIELDPETRLGKEIIKHKELFGQDYVVCHFHFPKDYPLRAPFVHLESPKLSGGTIFKGGLCADFLMNSWVPSTRPLPLLLQIRQVLLEHNVGIHDPGKNETWSLEEAQDGFSVAKKGHRHDKEF